MGHLARALARARKPGAPQVTGQVLAPTSADRLERIGPASEDRLERLGPAWVDHLVRPRAQASVDRRVIGRKMAQEQARESAQERALELKLISRVRAQAQA